MEVHVFLYHWCTAEEEGTDVLGVYSDFEKACVDMHRYMREVESRVRADYDDMDFDVDFAMDEKTYVSFGFYGRGCGMDHSWYGRIETMPVW